MRLFRNILASAAAVLAVASCVAIEGADTFSKNPVAPVMAAHNTILITDATKAEDVTFVWSKARFIDAADYLYDLYVTCGEKTVALAENLAATSYTLSKEEFRTFMKSEFELVQNSTHQISVYATITDNAGRVYESAPVTVSVYVFDDAVASELTGLETELVLDKETPAEEVALLTWTEPRLVYGEDVTYKVVLKIGEGEEKELVAGIYDTEYSTTVDALNDAVASAGGVEEQANDVDFIVYACCPSIPDGVASNAVTISITTYVASFPETLWVAGSHQGWNPATAPTLKQSTTVKGLYQGFLNLTDAGGGAEVEFKFCPAPNWGAGEYGFNGINASTSGSLNVNVVSSTTVAYENTKTPSGFYYVRLDKKFGTLDMIEVKNLELIGSFAASGWGNTISMVWDEASQSWTSAEEVVLKTDDELLVRFNSAWDHKFGGSFSAIEFAGENIKFAGAEGSYQVVLNASSADFTMRAVNMASDYFLVGGATGWSQTSKIIPLYPSSSSVFTFTTKFADGDNYYKFWASAEYGDWGLAYGYPGGDYAGESGAFTQGGSGAFRMPTADEYYTVTFDLSANTFTQTKLANQTPAEYSSIGIVGTFNGWTQNSDDFQMTQVEKAPHNWYLLDFVIADNSDGDTEEIKFNANKDWSISWGSGIDFDANRFGTMAEGANCRITPGTYDIYFNDITLQYLFIKK